MKTINLVKGQVTQRQVTGLRASDSANPFGIKPLAIETPTLTTEQSIEMHSLVKQGKLIDAIDYILHYSPNATLDNARHLVWASLEDY